MAFDRRCYVRESLSRRLLRSRVAFTASNSVFLIKIDENRHANFKHDKANKTLYKSDAHTCIRIYQTANWFITCIYAGAADTYCYSSVKTQLEQGAKNAIGLAMVGGSQKFSAWSFSQTEIRGYT